MNTVIKYNMFDQPASAGGSGGGNDMGLEAKVAKLEAHAEHIQSDVSDIKKNVVKLDDKIDSNFKWLLGSFISIFIFGFGGVLLTIAKGFHWL